MAKAKTAYVCTECGGRSSKWQGQCPHCAAWNTLVETLAVAPPTRFAAVAGGTAPEIRPLASVATRSEPRGPTGIEEFDRVLGGGLVPGAACLVRHGRRIAGADRDSRPAAGTDQRAGRAPRRSATRGYRGGHPHATARSRGDRLDPDRLHGG